MKPIFVIFGLFIALLSLTGCNNDKCDKAICLNGGTCNNGACQCPDGYSGVFCEIRNSSNPNNPVANPNIEVESEIGQNIQYIAPDGNGNFYFIGADYTTGSNTTPTIGKLNSALTKTWSVALDYTPRGLTVTDDGIIITGFRNGASASLGIIVAYNTAGMETDREILIDIPNITYSLLNSCAAYKHRTLDYPAAAGITQKRRMYLAVGAAFPNTQPITCRFSVSQAGSITLHETKRIATNMGDFVLNEVYNYPMDTTWINPTDNSTMQQGVVNMFVVSGYVRDPNTGAESRAAIVRLTQNVITDATLTNGFITALSDSCYTPDLLGSNFLWTTSASNLMNIKPGNGSMVMSYYYPDDLSRASVFLAGTIANTAPNTGSVSGLLYKFTFSTAIRSWYVEYNGTQQGEAFNGLGLIRTAGQPNKIMAVGHKGLFNGSGSSFGKAFTTVFNDDNGLTPILTYNEFGDNISAASFSTVAAHNSKFVAAGYYKDTESSVTDAKGWVVRVK